MTEREDIDVSDMDRDEIIQLTVNELLKCENCGKKNGGADKMGRAGYSIRLEFECNYCGFHNKNTAELK